MADEKKYVLAIDQGTTSSRAIVFDHSGQIVETGQIEHEQIFPRAGWVEHNAEEIWKNVREVVGLALVGDADRGEVLVREVGSGQREADHLTDVLPDLLRVVLDPAGAREDLLVLDLAGLDDLAGVVEDDRSGAGGSLVDGKDVLGVGHGEDSSGGSGGPDGARGG